MPAEGDDATAALPQSLDLGLGRDRGSVSILFVCSLFVITMIIALTVDGSGQIRTRQRAADVAAEAARVGAQGIDLAGAIRGAKKTINEASATALVTDYLKTMGATLVSIQLTNGDTRITVKVQLKYTATLMPLFNQNEYGVATAVLLQVNEAGTVT
jgi:Flp pilus assembly protein TadG